MRVITRWDEVLSSGETNEFLCNLALAILGDLPESTAREHITAGIISRDYRLLCNADLAYEELSAHTAIGLRQCLAFFAKRKDIDIGSDRRGAALSKFMEAEQACSTTNHIFRQWGAGRFQFRPRVESILHGAQRKISSILGDVPRLSELKPCFGPGATTKVKKRDASARSKLASGLACSEEFLGVLQEALEELPGWFSQSSHDDGDILARVSVDVHYAKLDFVPKNAKTDRSIGVEPVLNSMFQLGIGDYMARLLLRSGVDLRDQTKNQRLALVGSLTGALATLDLSSASDTISTELVYHLLPLDWFLLLSRLRTGTMEYQGSQIKLSKFSSMGNGFTFPLESLIFYALAWEVSERVLGRRPRADEISVYGDDIIVVAEAYPLLAEVLHACGFTVNSEKSFSTGPFRESCGSDYLRGIDIRPCYIKDRLDGPSLFVLHNFFYRRGQYELCNKITEIISPSLRLYGPDGYGDGHLLGEWVPKPIHRISESPFPECVRGVPVSDWRSSKYAQGYGGYTFDTFTLKSRKSFRPLPGDAVLPAYSIYASGEYSEMCDDELPARKGGFLRMVFRDDYRPGRGRLEVQDIPSAYRYDSRGRLGCVVPGTNGYKRISIYTLTA